MKPDRQRMLDALLRQDFATFLHRAFLTVSGSDAFAAGWHLDAISWELDRIRRGDSNRLIVTMPPRHLKSVTISVAWVAWMLGRDPALRFICVSYSQDLATKHAADCRAVMATEWYRRLFPGTVIRRGRSSETDFETTHGGGRLSTSTGGTLTGRGADIILIDDPVKPDEAMSETIRAGVKTWFGNTLYSRLNDKRTGCIVLVMQRLHEEDLAGHLIEAGGWEHLNLPAIAPADARIRTGPDRWHHRRTGEALHPDREDLGELERIRRVTGSMVFSAQYLQEPVPAEGNLVRRAWFGRYDEPPGRRPGDRIVQSWDTASKDGVQNDWSVCITALMRRDTFYVLDVLRRKMDFPTLRRTAAEHARAWSAGVLLIEDAASGMHLLQQLKADAPPGVPRPIGRKVEGDKITRFAAETSKIEAGQLNLPREAPWLAAFEHELLAFPNGRHDDQADALAQLLNWRPPHAGMTAGPVLVEGDY